MQGTSKVPFATVELESESNCYSAVEVINMAMESDTEQQSHQATTTIAIACSGEKRILFRTVYPRTGVLGN